MNIALILSAGVGQRFGGDIPKQYCKIMGKPVIEYALDACRLSKAVDSIVVVANGEYVENIHKKYGLPTVEGGSERNQSIKNGFDYVAVNYDCDKIIIMDAVQPIVTEKQIFQYFSLLDEYDHVVTCREITSSLERYDGAKVMRNEFFHTNAPEAFRFEVIAPIFDGNSPLTAVSHQLPSWATTYRCFDYPHNMKLTYPIDLKIAEVMLNECIIKPRQEKVLGKAKAWLSAVDQEETQRWFEAVPRYFDILRKRWDIRSYIMNPQSFTGIVYECYSGIYGNVIVKFDAPLLHRYQGEKRYYQEAGCGVMAKLLDFDDDFCALLTQQVYPGLQIKFDPDDAKLRDFFDKVAASFVEIDLADQNELRTVKEIFEDNAAQAAKYPFERELRKKFENVCRGLWDKYFKDAPKVLLHKDLQQRNILDAGDMFRAIDGQGVIGPYEFEFTRIHITDSMDEMPDILDSFIDKFNFFKPYGEPERINAALFIDWITVLDEWVNSGDSVKENVRWTVDVIKRLFYPNSEWDVEELPMPRLFA